MLTAIIQQGPLVAKAIEGQTHNEAISAVAIGAYALGIIGITGIGIYRCLRNEGCRLENHLYQTNNDNNV